MNYPEKTDLFMIHCLQKVERFETEREAYDFLFKKIRRVEDELRLKILLKAGDE